MIPKTGPQAAADNKLDEIVKEAVIYAPNFGNSVVPEHVISTMRATQSVTEVTNDGLLGAISVLAYELGEARKEIASLHKWLGTQQNMGMPMPNGMDMRSRVELLAADLQIVRNKQQQATMAAVPTPVPQTPRPGMKTGPCPYCHDTVELGDHHSCINNERIMLCVICEKRVLPGDAWRQMGINGDGHRACLEVRLPNSFVGLKPCASCDSMITKDDDFSTHLNTLTKVTTYAHKVCPKKLAKKKRSQS